MLVTLSSGLEQVNASYRGLELGIKSVADKANSELTFARKMNDQILLKQEYIRSILKISTKASIYEHL